MTFDLIIVGGGVAGCSVAYHAAKAGARVLVIEKKDVGGQASSVAAGMLAAQEEAAAPDAFFDACLASRELFGPLAQELEELSKIQTEWEKCGVWRVAGSEEEAKVLQEKLRWQRARGLSVEWQDPATVQEVHPGLAPTLGALYCPGDGQVNSAKWVQALAEAARRKGAHFLDHSAVVEFDRSGGHIRGVRTESEKFEAAHIVLAAGAWTSFLLDQLNAPLPLEPVKGQIMVLGGIPRAFRGPIFAPGGYLTPKSDGRIIIGSTMERVGFSLRPTLAAQRDLADWVAQWCPKLTNLPVIEMQAGLRPGTADGWPVMGKLEDFDNVWLATGHFRNGILLSPFTGRYMADGILTGRWDPLGAPFAPARFHTHARGHR